MGRDMDDNKEEPKSISGRKRRVDKKLTKTSGRHKSKIGITKKEFLVILDKASQPIKREVKSDSEQSQT